MEQYLVSARKYRPARFEDVVGQQHVTTTLKNALKSQKLAQSFLFTGPRGVGKTTCARILAKVINCENKTDDFEACDTCPSCQSFAKGTSLNVFELDAASNNSVEDIRALNEQVRYAPPSGKFKVYVLDEVHMLSSAAFNAFLKTLEEPPAHVVFILATTEKHKILPTILSRCQVFDFRRIGVTDMVKHLQSIAEDKNLTTEERALHLVAQKADGALRDALSIFDRLASFVDGGITYKKVLEQLSVLDHDYFFKIVDQLLLENSGAALNIFDEILKKGFDGAEFIHGLSAHLRDLLVCKDSQTAALLEVSQEVRADFEQQAKTASVHFILNALSIANECGMHYREAINKRLQVELALVKMAYLQQLVRPSLKPPTANPQKKTVVEAPAVKQEVSTENPKEANSAAPVNPIKAIRQELEKKQNGELPSELPLKKLEEPVVPVDNKRPETSIQEPTLQALEKADPKEADQAKKAMSQATAPAKKGGGMVLSSLTDLFAHQEKISSKEKKRQKVKDSDFTEARLQELWQSFSKSQDLSRARSILLSYTPTLEENTMIIVTHKRVDESLVRDYAPNFVEQTAKDEALLDFEMDIRLKHKEEDPSQKPKAFTDKDIFKEMMAANPQLHELQKRLKLDFKYG